MVDTSKNISRNKKGHTSRFLFCLTLLLITTHILMTGPTNTNLPTYALASEVSTAEIDTDTRRVYDEAGLLDSYEIDELEALSHEYRENTGIEFFILTHNDRDAAYPEKYVEDFEDSLPAGDRLYFLYDMYGNEIFIEGYGLAETYIHSKRIDTLFDNVAGYIKNGHYYDAFKTYITMSADYMDDDSELNYDYGYSYDSTPDGFDSNNDYGYDDYDYDGHYRKEKLKNSILLDFWFQLAVAFAIGAVVVGTLAYRSSGRMTAGARDYLDRSRQGLIGRRDQFIRSSVIRWRKPQQNSSSGGSRGGFNAGGFRGGRSSGGRSHSSGGRKL